MACAPHARDAPANRMLAGNNQGIARRSASWPKTGWTTDEVALIANTKPAAAALEKCRPSTRNGASAGTIPWHKSIRKCPNDSSARARRFIRSLLILVIGRQPLWRRRHLRHDDRIGGFLTMS